MEQNINVVERVNLRKGGSNTLDPFKCEYITKRISIKERWRDIKNYFTFLVLIKKEGKGYIARCPELKGCWSEGDSFKEIKKNILEAIQLYLDIDFKPKIIIERI